MKVIKQIDESVMVVTFLKAEIDSKRFQGYIHKVLTAKKISLDIISKPNLDNIEDNKLRYQILTDYRGYGNRSALFENFPLQVDWYEVELDKEDISKIKYINYDYWNELSNNTRLASEAAKNIRNGKTVFKQPNVYFLEAAETLRNGKVFPELILVSKNKDSYLVGVEGNLRLTAYALEPQKVPDKSKAIVGFSSTMDKWGLY